MSSEETEQRAAGYITLPLAVLDGWVGQNAQYLKWWTQLRREASWTDKTAYSGDTRSPIPVISVHSVGNLQYRWQS